MNEGGLRGTIALPQPAVNGIFRESSGGQPLAAQSEKGRRVTPAALPYCVLLELDYFTSTKLLGALVDSPFGKTIL